MLKNPLMFVVEVGLLGEPRVNVFAINLALDSYSPKR